MKRQAIRLFEFADFSVVVPNMKLRLMGLRCTHLVSAKKPDTRSFFGLQPFKAEEAISETSHNSHLSKRKAQELASNDADGENYEDFFDIDEPSEDSEYLTLPESMQSEVVHKELSNLSDDTKVTEQVWDCPICERPQPADERCFNNHLDSCLSRETIRAAVQRDATESPPLLLETPAAKRNKTGGGVKKRSRPTGPSDPRQQKLSFG
ncbi:hypothetical protein GGS21DRAFT_434089 [Xylaria nigripes]|nr:hypothetical protein GGS21DRAFT_434089 [Xylaria nigripes]